jgi:four helix bundle protein
MKIEKFEDIESWRLARELTNMIYASCKVGDFAKDYGLKDQIQRASGSIMHNIAEGFDGGSDAELAKFLRYAQRSCSELKSQLYVALDQSYITQKEFLDLYHLADVIHSKIGGFIAYFKKVASSNKQEKDKAPRTKHQGQRKNHEHAYSH